MAVERTILLRGNEFTVHDEGIVDSANVFPGMCIELKSNGNYDILASTQAESLKRNVLRIAKEDPYQGKTINDAYASGARLFFFTPRPGDHALLLVKAGQNIVVNDKIVEEGAASGKFVEAAGTETKYRAVALESSGGALAADTLIKCEWV